MAEYWDINNKIKVSLSPSKASERDDLILVKNKSYLDRTGELPTCEAKYIKYYIDEYGSTFPTEMTQAEKDAVDVELLNQFKKIKKKQILEEAERRISNENTDSELGPFLGLEDTDRELKVISALALLIKAHKAANDLKSLTQEEKTTLTVLGLEFDAAKEIKDVADDINTLEVDDPGKETREQIELIKVRDNPKWTE